MEALALAGLPAGLVFSIVVRSSYADVMGFAQFNWSETFLFYGHIMCVWLAVGVYVCVCVCPRGSITPYVEGRVF